MSDDIQLKSSRLSPAKRALLEKRLKGVAASAPKADENRIPKRSDPRSAPLSFSQERLWFFQQIQPGSTVFNMPMAARLRGPLNVDALRRTINEIRRRHEVLRSAYVQTDGRMLQVIHDPTDEDIQTVDLTALDPTEREEKARSFADEEAERPFDLGKGHFFRAKLLQFSKDDHLLLLTMHHIAFDGWSTGVLNRELELLYGAFAEGRASPLPEPSVQYADYSIWLREQIRGDAMARQVEYWKGCLRDAPALLDLPTDRPRPAVQTYNGGSISSFLPPELVQQLSDLGQREGATLFMTFLAAFQLLLHRLSGQEDIVIGMPIAGRNRVELEGLLGFFLNTLPLRTSLAGNITFIELIRRARTTALGAFGNQDVPFDKLVEELHPERSLSHSPIFQVLINMYDFATDSLNLSNLKVELLSPSATHSKFDLTLYIEQRRKGIEFQLVYNTALFDRPRMAEFLSQFENLLAQVAARPESRIDELSLLTSSSSRVLPDPTRALCTGAEDTIHETFRRQAGRNPGRTAVSDRHSEWSYGELESSSNRIGNFLIKKGVKKGDAVAIFAHRGAPMVSAMLGILKAGAAFVVIDPAYPVTRIVDSLRIANPSAWIQLEEAGALPENLELFLTELALPRLVLPAVRQAAPALKGISSDVPSVRVSPDDVAYIAFTSGSSGKPKGVLGTHRPVSHFVQWHAATHGLRESDRFAMLSGLAHDPLLRDIFTPLSIGASLHIPNLDAITSTDEVAHWMKDHEITIAHLTPAFGQLLACGERVILPKLRYGFYGADVLTRRDVAILERIAPAAMCVNFYGATETPQAIAFYPVETSQTNGTSSTPVLEERIPIGTGIDGVQLLVLNRAGRLAGVGELGELSVRTPYLSRGYVGDPKTTEEKFAVNPFTHLESDRMYRTGDLARYRPDGAAEFAGRADNQVKIRGFRVELRDVEMALRSLGAVRDATVIARQASPSDRQITGYVVPKAGQTINAHDIRLQLKQRIPDYMIPTHFVSLETIPLTPNGKIDYRSLPAPQALHPEREKGFVAPRDPVEELMARIWAEVLGVAKVGIHDNFFDLGGHSLMCLQIINQLHKAGLWVTAPQFFQHPTIAELASVATTAPAAAADEDGGSSLVALRPRGTRPPLFLVHTVPGDVLGYINLVNLLGDDQPCYGFQSLGLQSLDRAHRTIPEMAAHYVKLLRHFQPEGPYYLAGWCFGGIVAMEMADQLLAQGQKIAILALFETWAHPPAEGKFKFALNRMRCFLKMDVGRQLRYLKQKSRFYYAWYFNKKLVNQVIEERFGFSIAHGPLASREEVYRINLQASRNYPSRPFPGRITLFNAEEIGDERIPDPTGGFATLAHDIEIHPVPGEHMSVLKEPHVSVLAARLKNCLRETHERLGINPPPKPEPIASSVKAPEPAPAQDLELTPNQQQVWVAQKLHPDTLYYNVAGIGRFEKPVDPKLLERAVRTMVSSSDALRTIIVERDGMPFRRVLADIPFEFEQVDLSKESDPERSWREWIQKRVSRRFDLSSRMFDFALLKISATEQIIYTGFHHLIGDGWSIIVIGQTLSCFYKRAQEGKLRDIEPMPLYEDYVRHEREHRASERHRKNEVYWNKKLEGNIGPIPFHGQVVKRKSTLTRRIPRELGAARIARLQELAGENGSVPNLFFMLLAAYIYRATGQQTFMLGIPFHNRRNREFKEMIGFFSEVLPLRIEIAPDETFTSLAAKIRAQTIETIRHGPFSLQRRDRAPGHDAILNFHPTFISDFAGITMRSEWVSTGHGFEGLAVQVHSNDQDAGLKLELDFHCDVFSQEQAKQAADEFLGLIDEFLNNPQGALVPARS